ncbi:LysR family transcriptional regulator [Paracoccus isoporae]|uniref:LysR family transcriptional regulator n=1 Tax=Paracoccus isoporae TaxID=591205 RepID=UPI0015A301DC
MLSATPPVEQTVADGEASKNNILSLSDHENPESLHLDFRQISIFKAVSDADSIDGAAEQKRYASAVIAHHLVNLEPRLKQTILDRSSRGAVPPPAGQHFHHPAVAIPRAIDSAEIDMQHQSDWLLGRVVLRIASSAVIAWPYNRCSVSQLSGRNRSLKWPTVALGRQ